MEEIKVYKTEDGKVFETIEKAKKHEELIEFLDATYTNSEIERMIDAMVFDSWEKKDFIKWEMQKLNEMKSYLMQIWREE